MDFVHSFLRCDLNHWSNDVPDTALIGIAIGVRSTGIKKCVNFCPKCPIVVGCKDEELLVDVSDWGPDMVAAYIWLVVIAGATYFKVPDVNHWGGKCAKKHGCGGSRRACLQYDQIVQKANVGSGSRLKNWDGRNSLNDLGPKQ